MTINLPSTLTFPARNLIKGFENISAAFIDLFRGENINKQMVKVSGID